MEVGVNPALCLSNREIDERIGVSTQPLQTRSVGRHLSRFGRKPRMTKAHERSSR